MTRILLTKIPFYKEVVLMSFACDHCGYQNNEIQPSGKIQTKGLRVELTVKVAKDLNRRVVKSDYSSVRIVELDFEIPAKSQKGEVTTVEGIIERVITGLEQDQVVRRIEHPEAAEKIDEFMDKLRQLKELQTPFTIILEDASGNAFIENFLAPSTDPQMKTSYFTRTKEQDHMLGLFDLNEVKESGEGSEEKPGDAVIEPESVKEEDRNRLRMIPDGSFPLEEFDKEVLQFRTECPDCGAACETNMKVTKIPHFKEVVIMATICENCGHKTNEVKCGGGIEEKGIRIHVKVRDRNDFSRDILNSEFCSISIPELEVDVGPHALGGRFTTVEGLLQAMKSQLHEQSGMFFDSQDVEQKRRMETFFAKLDQVLDSKIEVTLVLDDPTGNSFVQSLTDDMDEDTGVRIFHYYRSHEQNEELGLNDMKTDNYQPLDELNEEDEDEDANNS